MINRNYSVSLTSLAFSALSLIGLVGSLIAPIGACADLPPDLSTKLNPPSKVSALDSAKFITIADRKPDETLTVNYRPGGCDLSKHKTEFVLKNLKINREVQGYYHEIYATADIEVMERTYGFCTASYQITASANLKALLVTQAKEMGIDIAAPKTLFGVTFSLATPVSGGTVSMTE